METIVELLLGLAKRLSSLQAYQISQFAVAVLTVYASWKVVYSLWLSPLAKVPGPLICHLSSLPVRIQSALGNRAKYAERLTRKYGPIVVIGPGKVAISDPEIYRRIMGTHKFLKDDGYKFSDNPVPNTFSTLDPEFNKLRRRQLSSILSVPKLSELEDTIVDVGPGALIKKLKKMIISSPNKKARINYHDEFIYMTYDVIGELAFGESFGMLEKSDISVIRYTESGISLRATYRHLPILRYIPFILPNMRREYKEALKISELAVRKQKEMLAQKKMEPKSLLHYFLEAQANDPGAQLGKDEIHSEMFLMLLAGTDTTSLSLSWTIHLLLLHPEILHRVTSEVRSTFPDRSQIIHYKDAREKLPYLEAILYESIRLCPVAAGLLPRLVPKGGVSFQEYFFPEGTIVNCFNGGVCWNEKVFPRPFRFDPDRFLGDTALENKKNLFTFSFGVRVCPGRSLAWMEMFLVMANFLRDFDMEMPSDLPYGPHIKDPSRDHEPMLMPSISVATMGPKYPDRDCWVNLSLAND